MDEYPNEDTLVDRAMAVASIGATADSIPDGHIRERLLAAMDILIDSMRPPQKAGNITRIK